MNEVAELRVSAGNPSYWQFGSSVAVQGDTIAVGALDWEAPGEPGYYSRGAVFVYEKPASGWQGVITETARLTSSDPDITQRLGHSVAISGDTIVAGAPLVSLGGGTFDNYGAVYVFTRNGSSWTNSTQTARLIASDRGARDELGNAVAISGNTIVASAYQANIGANVAAGALYVFEKPPGGWADSVEVAKLHASDGANDDAGDNLGDALAFDGNTILAGRPWTNFVTPRGIQYGVGAVFVFSRPPGGWSGVLTENAMLRVSDAKEDDGVGSAVAFWGDTALVGIPYYGDPVTGEGRGAIAMFRRPSSGWSGVLFEDSKMLPSDPMEGDSFGESVAVSGSVAVVGAPYRSIAGLRDVGHAYVFEQQALCTAVPRTGCKQVASTASGKPAIALLRPRADRAYDRVVFRWKPGQATTMAEFGDPSLDRTYALCVYDETPSGFVLLVDTTASPGGVCANKPCWRLNRSGTKWLFRNPELTPDGMLRMDLQSGPDGSARVVAVAKGYRAGVPPLPVQQATRVVAQVVNDLGTCWSAEFTAPAKKNTDKKFTDSD